MRWVGVALVVVLLLAGWLAYDRPDLFPGSADIDMTRLIYLVMALILVGGSALGLAQGRARGEEGKGPGAMTSLLIWAGLIGLLFLLYQGAQFWTNAPAMFR